MSDAEFRCRDFERLRRSQLLVDLVRVTTSRIWESATTASTGDPSRLKGQTREPASESPDHRREPAGAVRPPRLAEATTLQRAGYGSRDLPERPQGRANATSSPGRHPRSIATRCPSKRAARSATRSNTRWRAVLAVRLAWRVFVAPRLRRHPCLQPARHDLSRRRLLQAAVRQEVHLRPPRHQPRALRGEVRPPRTWLYRLVLLLERWTFRTADSRLRPTNPTGASPIERGRHAARARVRGPHRAPSRRGSVDVPPVEQLKRGRRFLVGYVGVIGDAGGARSADRGRAAHGRAAPPDGRPFHGWSAAARARSPRSRWPSARA